jgi:hypothetical protein
MRPAVGKRKITQAYWVSFDGLQDPTATRLKLKATELYLNGKRCKYWLTEDDPK